MSEPAPTPTLADPLLQRACSWLARRSEDGWAPGPSWPAPQIVGERPLPWLTGRMTGIVE